MKNLFFLVIALMIAVFSFHHLDQTASQTKVFDQLKLGMTPDQVQDLLGYPTDKSDVETTYILDDSSEILLSFRDNELSSAKLKLKTPMKVSDSALSQLRMVQLSAPSLMESRPSWFYAGKPEDGLIYKINAEGYIESLTLVPPFTYQYQPKQLQALYSEFKQSYDETN